jgi:hypothetical protein
LRQAEAGCKTRQKTSPLYGFETGGLNGRNIWDFRGYRKPMLKITPLRTVFRCKLILDLLRGGPQFIAYVSSLLLEAVKVFASRHRYKFDMVF